MLVEYWDMQGEFKVAEQSRLPKVILDDFEKIQVSCDISAG
jgi:hypothetical protein